MANSGLIFHPLYWIYHDFWTFSNQVAASEGRYQTVYYPHAGHIHFFMMNFPVQNNPIQQAYSGAQTYNFSLSNQWASGSSDPNQQQNAKIVGSPKWYFYIEEYWRRVYIQQWQNFDNPSTPGVVGKKGLMYDASLPAHTRGPFREGKGSYFFTTNLNRTLPVEYWRDELKTKRDHLLRYGDGVDSSKQLVWDFKNDYPVQVKTTGTWYEQFQGWDGFPIPRAANATGDMSINGTTYVNTFTDEDEARNQGYPDRQYMTPAIEYQKVVQLNWERLPGWQERDVDNEMTGTTFGDGFSLQISSPYTVNNVIQSPFSDDKGNVAPPGTYFHNNVPDANKLKFRSDNYWHQGEAVPSTLYYPTQSQMGNVATFNKPNSAWATDGMWVEQCLGALVQAKARIIVEDNYGGRTAYWINNTAFSSTDSFIGADNSDPFPTS